MNGSNERRINRCQERLVARSSIIGSLERAKYSASLKVNVRVRVFASSQFVLGPSFSEFAAAVVVTRPSEWTARKAMLISLMIGRFDSLSLRSNHHHHHHQVGLGISEMASVAQCASAITSTPTPHSSLFLQMTHFVLVVLY